MACNIIIVLVSKDHMSSCSSNLHSLQSTMQDIVSAFLPEHDPCFDDYYEFTNWALLLLFVVIFAAVHAVFGLYTLSRF